MEKILKNHTDVMIFQSAICVGASQIAIDGRREIAYADFSPPRRVECSDMEEYMAKIKLEEPEYKWKDRKRTLFGLPLSFTTYKVTEDKFIVRSGFFSTKEEEIRLYRIMDVTLRRSLGQKIFRLGTVHLCSSDRTTPEFDVKNIKQSEQVKNLLSDLVEAARAKNRVTAREYMTDDDEDIDDDHN